MKQTVKIVEIVRREPWEDTYFDVILSDALELPDYNIHKNGWRYFERFTEDKSNVELRPHIAVRGEKIVDEISAMLKVMRVLRRHGVKILTE